MKNPTKLLDFGSWAVKYVQLVIIKHIRPAMSRMQPVTSHIHLVMSHMQPVISRPIDWTNGSRSATS